MGSMHYATLASARSADPEMFDRNIKSSMYEAAQQVGKDVVIRALCAQGEVKQLRKAA